MFVTKNSQKYSMNSSKKSCQKTNQAVIKVCHGRHCESVGKFILERAEEEISQNSYKNISAEKCPCQANCAKAATVVVEKNGKKNIYNYASPTDLPKIIKQNL